jgi:hypothetical protein
MTKQTHIMTAPVVTTRCIDCGVGTITSREWYMVKNEVWDQAWVGRRKSWHWQTMGQEILCIGCLEQRLGRMLTASDFTDAPVNDPNKQLMSKRLRQRLAARRARAAMHRAQRGSTTVEAG